MEVSMIHTNLGLELLAKIEQGIPLQITRVCSGTGKNEDLKSMILMENIKQEFEITGKEQRENQAIIYVRLTNSGLLEGYDLAQVGVFANDPDRGEILYRIAQFEKEIHIFSEKAFPDYSLISQITDTISNASQFKVSINPTGLVTHIEFENHIKNTSVHLSSEDKNLLENIDDLFLRKSGGTMTGQLINTHSLIVGNSNQPLGEGAFVQGKNCVASGNQASSFGTTSSATGNNTHAEGSGCIASGICAHAEGNETEASGSMSHSEGNLTKATKDQAHAEGFFTTASAISAHAEGGRTTAGGDYSHSEGFETAANGEHSHAEGFRTSATETSAHAEGDDCHATGKSSHAEGESCVSQGIRSHAEGQETTASGNASHSEGRGTLASGNNSHAEGEDTIASGTSSHAQGRNTQAQAAYSSATGYYTQTFFVNSCTMGRYNSAGIPLQESWTIDGDVLVIGNGSSISRSNCFRVTNDGKVYALSAFNSTGADYSEYFEWADGNPNNEERLGHFITLDGDKIKIANDKDDYILGVVTTNPSVVGNGDNGSWAKMYLCDEWDRPLYEDVPIERTFDVIHHEKITGDDGKILQEAYDEEIEIEPGGIEKRFKINPEYDPNREFISREKRAEWAAIGMLGQLWVYHDGSCEANGYCTSNSDGIATKSDKGYRVICKKNDLIKIIFR